MLNQRHQKAQDRPANYDLFDQSFAAAPKLTQAQHTAWIHSLSNQERIAIIRRFKPDNEAMPFEEILFALRRGESLHVRSAKGEWLKSYGWSYIDANNSKPTEHNWITGTSRAGALEDIPAVGKQFIDGEECTVVFHQIGDAPIWRTH